MKTLVSLLLALAIVLPAAVSAQTFLQNYKAKAAKVQTAITTSKLSPAIRQGFLDRLAAIHLGACSTRELSTLASSDPKTCANATPEKIEDANDKLNQLSDDLADAIKKDGSQSLAQLYAPQITALTAKLKKATTIDPLDAKNLTQRISVFQTSLAEADKGGSSAGPLGSKGASKNDADAIADRFQKLSDDVDAAIALSQEKGEDAGFLAAFKTHQSNLVKKIQSSKLDKSISNGLAAEVQAVTASPWKGTDGAAADAAAAFKSPGQAAAKKGACAPTASSIEKAEDALTKLSDEFDAALAADGSKSLPALYAPKLAALTTKLNAASVDSADRSKLNQRIKDFPSTLGVDKTKTTYRGPDNAKSKTTVVDPIQDAADRFQSLSDDVDAAVQLAQDKGASLGFAKELKTNGAALDTRIDKTVLAAPLKADFHAQVAKALNDACTLTGAEKGLVKGAAQSLAQSNCPGGTPTKFEAAEAALEKIGAALDAAVAADGAKTLPQLYKDRVEALKTKLLASNVDAADKKRLSDRLAAFAKNPGAPTNPASTSKGWDFVTKAAEDYDQLSNDIAAAIKLSPISAADGQPLAAQVMDLQAKLKIAPIPAAVKSPLDARCTTLYKGLSTGTSHLSIDDAKDAVKTLTADVKTALDGSKN